MSGILKKVGCRRVGASRITSIIYIYIYIYIYTQTTMGMQETHTRIDVFISFKS